MARREPRPSEAIAVEPGPGRAGVLKKGTVLFGGWVFGFGSLLPCIGV